MKIIFEDLIKEFYKENEEDLHGLSLKEVRDICIFPFKSIRKHIESGLLPSIRIMYLGVFQVYKKKAKSELSQLRKKHEEGHITTSQYEEYKNVLKTYLDGE
jgi:nucleoid DNA-binding protein